MVRHRTLAAATGTAVLHLGGLVWLSASAMVPPSPAVESSPPSPIEVVWLDGEVFSATPQQAGADVDAPPEAPQQVQPLAAPASADNATHHPRRVGPQRVRVTETPAATPDSVQARFGEHGAPESEAADAAVGPVVGPVQDDTSEDPGELDTPVGVGQRLGAGEGDAALDYDAYGALIGRIIAREVRRDPVAGVRAIDEVVVEVAVLPDGTLERRAKGRLGFARVLWSTVGPLRTRALLRRIQRASRRFPEHPATYPRDRYVVGVHLRFNRVDC